MTFSPTCLGLTIIAFGFDGFTGKSCPEFESQDLENKLYVTCL